MARLRQISPQSYGSSSSIHTEFESVIRYLNAAEIGNKTISELLSTIFDEDGRWAGPVEFRRDASEGIEYRVGEYATEDDGWQSLISLEDLRGEPGTNMGEIGAPLLYARQDYAPTNGTTTLNYAFEPEDAVLVFENGLLLQEGGLFDYTLNPAGGVGGQIIFNSAFAGTENVSVFKVRSELVTGFSRADYNPVTSQTTFAFVHDETSTLLVFKNGILQRLGGSYDYVTDAVLDTVTFLAPVTAGSLVSIMTIENPLTTTVTGLMLEENFVDLTTGLIKYAKLGVADGQIPMAKVAGLSAHVTAAAKLTVSASTPITPAAGALWLDTATSPNQLKFYDGTQWLKTTPVSSLPAFTASNALQLMRVNGTGTALEYANVDLSGVIPNSQKGAASGVATLDGSAKLPLSQLPTGISRATANLVVSGAVANGTLTVQRLWNQRVNMDAVSLRLGAGTASAQLAINGVGVGTVFAVSTTPTEVKLGQGGNPDSPQDIDATGASKTIGVIITSASGASGLDVAVGYSITQ